MTWSYNGTVVKGVLSPDTRLPGVLLMREEATMSPKAEVVLSVVTTCRPGGRGVSQTPTGMVETIVEIFYEDVKVRKGLLTEVPAGA